MDTDNQIVKVRITNLNEEHFRKLGYTFELNDIVEIPAKDLTTGSGILVDVECSYCHRIFKQQYRRYFKTKNKPCCDKCKEKKMMETSLRKYGNVCSLCNPEVRNKAKDTNIKNLGVEYPFQSEEILKKCTDTTIKKYGSTRNVKGISKQQRYVCEYFGGILNYSLYPYFLDILLPDEKIDIEWDGSGHDLSVRLGNITREEFNQNEQKRNDFVISNGYKVCRIICSSDIIPSDDILDKIKSRIIQILSGDSSIYILNLDNKTETIY